MQKKFSSAYYSFHIFELLLIKCGFIDITSSDLCFLSISIFNGLSSVQDEDDSDEDKSDEETPKKVARSYWSFLFS